MSLARQPGNSPPRPPSPEYEERIEHVDGADENRVCAGLKMVIDADAGKPLQGRTETLWDKMMSQQDDGQPYLTHHLVPQCLGPTLERFASISIYYHLQTSTDPVFICTINMLNSLFIFRTWGPGGGVPWLACQTHYYGFIVSQSGMPSASSDKVNFATYGLQGHHHDLYTSGSTIGSVHMHFRRTTLGSMDLSRHIKFKKLSLLSFYYTLKFSKQKI